MTKPRIWQALSTQRAVVCACAGLAAGGCIQRTLVCPPLGSSGAQGASGAEPLLGPGGAKAFVVQGDADKIVVSTVPVTGQSFADATRVAVNKGSGHEWAVQLQAPTIGVVAQGDVLLATFYFRTEKPLEDSGVGQTQFVFEEAKEPYAKSVTYDVQSGSDWRRVNVPFVAKQKFDAGAAHMIFRLGYEPETIDIADVTVQDFGKKVTVASLPTTAPWSPPRKPPPAVVAEVEGGALSVTVDPSQTVGAISPYVYGINSQDADGIGVTVRRMGGNRQTAYNWEINASSAGSDYHHVNDDWPCTSLSYPNCDEPGAQFVDFAKSNRRLGAESIATVPMVDYVAADKGHEVPDADKAPSKRYLRSFPKKNGPLSLSPDLHDGNVYEDEFVSFLVHTLGTADKGGIKFYSLDNEPALWSSTHPRVHPAKTTYQEMIARTEATATEITALDPSAVVLGGVMFGWSEFLSLQDAPDAKDYASKYETYVDFYLSQMKELEDKYHRRLVHVLDVHWYPEAKGAKRITDDDVSPKTIAARVQAPRAFWDPTYREKSWIDDSLGGKSIRLVPWLREKIAKDYPGTKLSMTEYDFGTPEHISGGIAQVDVLGVLGREGVYMANYWGHGAGNGKLPSYVTGAFKLYRNFDGKGGTYGDTAVSATVPDATKASVFAATDSKRPNLLTVIVVNKDQAARYAGQIKLAGAAQYATVRAYVLDKSSPEVHPGPAVAIKDNRIDYALPPLSATLFVCEKR